jgi:hypothetical protein
VRPLHVHVEVPAYLRTVLASRRTSVPFGRRIVTVTRAWRERVTLNVAFVGNGAKDSAKGEPVTLNELITGAAASVEAGAAPSHGITRVAIATSSGLRTFIRTRSPTRCRTDEIAPSPEV